MKFNKELFPFFIDFVNETYGGGLEVHQPPKGEELARGFIDSNFIALEETGNLIRTVTNNAKFVEEELQVVWNNYLNEMLKLREEDESSTAIEE